MKPNLTRIPAKGDLRAQQILDRPPTRVDSRFLESLDRGAFLDLGRYGTRQATLALRQRSPDRLRGALLATAIAALDGTTDDRDLMVGLALPHVVADHLGIEPGILFSETAARLPEGRIPDLIRAFGARKDVTPTAFSWHMIETVDGPDFLPT